MSGFGRFKIFSDDIQVLLRSNSQDSLETLDEQTHEGDNEGQQNV